jgi:hypothetical protein
MLNGICVASPTDRNIANRNRATSAKAFYKERDAASALKFEDRSTPYIIPDSEMLESFMDLGSLRVYCWPLFTKAHTGRLIAAVVSVFFSCVFTGYCLAGQGGLSSMQAAEYWEDIATIRLQVAQDHEIQSGDIATGASPSTLNAGDLLDLVGDERFLAAENYRIASQQWDKAAMAYISAGASVEAKKARENVKTALAAAKRALSDGVYFHMKAKEQYQATNNLVKKMDALDKAARNLERLMEMK